MSKVNLDQVNNILDIAGKAIDELDGMELDDRNGIKTNGRAFEDNYNSARQQRAAATRQLLVMADQLELASNLVRNEYWKTKGYPDALA